MIKSESEKSIVKSDTLGDNVCNLIYLTDMMAGNKSLIKGVMDAFLKQVPEDLQFINDAVIQIDYAIIKNVAHAMKSTVSVMGISVLVPVLLEMEDLGAKEADFEKIIELNKKLNLICKQAMEEIEREKTKYV